MIINETQSSLKEILRDLWSLDNLYIAYEDNPDFVETRDNLIKLLTSDVEQANSLLDTLDFNNLMESHVLNFIPDIIERFTTLEEQKLFISHLESLQKEFPNIDFSRAIFYAKLSDKK